MMEMDLDHKHFGQNSHHEDSYKAQRQMREIPEGLEWQKCREHREKAWGVIYVTSSLVLCQVYSCILLCLLQSVVVLPRLLVPLSKTVDLFTCLNQQSQNTPSDTSDCTLPPSM